MKVGFRKDQNLLTSCQSGFLNTLLVTAPSVAQVVCAEEIVMLCYDGF